MDEIMKVRMTKEFMEQLFVRDSEGNKLSVEWGEEDKEGFYCPTISVDYDDNIVAQFEAALKEIAEHPHCSYANASGEYGRGAVDGHRCAAKIARKALKVGWDETTHRLGKEPA